MDPKYEAFVENDLKPSKTRAAAQLLLLLAHFLVASCLATVTHIDTCCDDSYRDCDIHWRKLQVLNWFRWLNLSKLQAIWRFSSNCEKLQAAAWFAKQRSAPVRDSRQFQIMNLRKLQAAEPKKFQVGAPSQPLSHESSENDTKCQFHHTPALHIFISIAICERLLSPCLQSHSFYDTFTFDETTTGCMTCFSSIEVLPLSENANSLVAMIMPIY